MHYRVYHTGFWIKANLDGCLNKKWVYSENLAVIYRRCAGVQSCNEAVNRGGGVYVDEGEATCLPWSS